MNEQLTNATNVLHNHLFLSLDRSAKVKIYTTAPIVGRPTGLPTMEIFQFAFDLVISPIALVFPNPQYQK